MIENIVADGKELVEGQNLSIEEFMSFGLTKVTDAGEHQAIYKTKMNDDGARYLIKKTIEDNFTVKRVYRV